MPSQIRVVFNNLPQLAASLGVSSNAIVAATAEQIAADARGRAPVGETGALAGGIAAHQVGQSHYEVTTSDVREAVYQEYGGRGGAHPYMVPSAHNAEPGFRDAMSQIIPGA